MFLGSNFLSCFFVGQSPISAADVAKWGFLDGMDSDDNDRIEIAIQSAEQFITSVTFKPIFKRTITEIHKICNSNQIVTHFSPLDTIVSVKDDNDNELSYNLLYNNTIEILGYHGILKVEAIFGMDPDNLPKDAKTALMDLALARFDNPNASSDSKTNSLPGSAREYIMLNKKIV